MSNRPHDFGTGLRAHLGLDAAQLDLAADLAAPPLQPVVELVEEEVEAQDEERFEALAALEAELLERQRRLELRETTLAGEAGSLLAAAQALYDEVLGGGRDLNDDELARLRRRKSVA